MTETQRYLTLAVTVCTGLCAGVFFAFSTFVMPALHRLPAGEAVRAMQAINRAAPNGLFMTVLFAPLFALAWLGYALVRSPGPATGYLIAGGVLLLAGLLVLVTYHVPHNNALDAVNSHAATIEGTWQRYYDGWTAWNHVRTGLFTASTACLALAAVRG